MKNKKSGKLLVLTITILFFCIATPATATAGVGFSLTPFAGMSGTTMIFFFTDVLLDAEGEVMDFAGDYGFISGELGLAAGINIKYFGVRAEALWGYYNYNALKLPSKTYDMFMAGLEPYILLSRINLFAGGGVFMGFTHEEVLGQKVGSTRNNRGYAAWIGIGYLWYKSFEINFRARWHHFTHIERDESDEEKLRDDIVLVLRGMFHFKIL